MTFEQAVELAGEINAMPGYEVLAVGRFVEEKHLQDATKWGVSLFVVATRNRILCWDRDGWLKLTGVGTGPRRDAHLRVDEEQLSLF